MDTQTGSRQSLCLATSSEDSREPVLKKTRRMRNYRRNVRTDPERHERAKEKDRERKREKGLQRERNC